MYRNAASTVRRTHRERSQPAARKRLGMLEKKKDYVKRARDFNKKKKRLKALEEKAAFRNPEEFYFRMQRSRMRKGAHKDYEDDTLPHETLQLMKTQDVAYVTHKKVADMKKIEKMRAALHFLEEEADADGTHATPATGGSDAGSDAGSDDDAWGEDGINWDAAFAAAEKAAPKAAADGGGQVRVNARHTIFVDDDEEAASFDAAKHFNTLPELAGRTFNRPTLERLAEPGAVVGPRDNRALKKLEKARRAQYKELKKRVDRHDELQRVMLRMQLQKEAMGKGRKKKLSGKGPTAVFKWKKERKR